MPEQQTFVIVGGGMAGAKAAAGLREGGFGGRILLISEEPTPPYQRPPLSKDYLAGDSTVADAQVLDEGFHAGHGVELLTATRATSVDTALRRVELSNGDLVGYDRLLIATGAGGYDLHDHGHTGGAT